MKVHTVTQEDTDIASTVNYATQQVEHIWGYSVQFIWTTTFSDATIKLQASNDAENWDDITGASATIGNVGDSKLFNCPEVMYKFVRARVEVVAGKLDTIKIITYIKGQ